MMQIARTDQPGSSETDPRLDACPFPFFVRFRGRQVTTAMLPLEGNMTLS
jgi:hypothetical protein